MNQASDTVYHYDAENQRIGVNQTQYVVNSQPALSQVLVKEDNGQKTFYVYGLGLIGQESDGEYLSDHFDYRGSTVALTSDTAQVIERFQYSPYGMLLSGDSSITPFLFNGMYGVMSDSNGLYYMRARFYSPEIRRFVNQDVLLGDVFEGQTLNRYAFVTGRPVSFVDPFGLAYSPGEHGNYDCFYSYKKDNCEQSEDDPRPYVGFASDKTFFWFLGGLSHQTAIIFDLSTGKRCVTSTYCGIIGIGLHLGTSVGAPLGISMKDIEQSLAGLSIGVAGEFALSGIGGGFDLSCGIDKEGITSIGSSKAPVKASAGGGAWIGIPMCQTKILMCF